MDLQAEMKDREDIRVNTFIEKVENDSIFSPEYLNLVKTSSETQNYLEETPLTDDNNPKQERRQVIKILDQSKWRA